MPDVGRQGDAEAAPRGPEDLKALQKAALEEIASAADQAALQALRVKLLGKKGVLTAQLKGLGALSAEARKTRGRPSTRPNGRSRPLLPRGARLWSARRSRGSFSASAST